MDYKNKVIKAIYQNKLKVTSADIAATTGLSYFEANNALNSIASETGGNLEVTSSGQILYKFSSGFENAYLVQGFQKILLTIFKTVFNALFYLFRISFGIFLILSILVVILFIMAMLLSRGSDNDRDGGGGFSSDIWNYIIVRDVFDLIFAWNYNNNYYNYNSSNNYNKYNQKNNDQNFLMACFSFLFGDGDPNSNFEETKWRAIAQFIQRHNGVVTCEQLAPFTGNNPKDENQILPILTRFEGLPQVSDRGNIVYVFPKMMVTTNHSIIKSGDEYVLEKKLNFTNYSIEGVVIAAFINFFGVWFLWSASYTHLTLFVFRPLFAVLCFYGTMFLVIPTIRLISILFINARIESRNQLKMEYYNNLENADTDLQNKLQDARQFALKNQNLIDEKVIYTTQKDNLEQAIDEN